MRKKRKTLHSKICFIFVILILSLSFISISYSHWGDDVEIHGIVTSGSWDPCVKIRKTLQEGCNDSPDCFLMTIEVMNNGSSDLTNVEITDTFGIIVTPLSDTMVISKGTAYLTDKNLTWNVGDLSIDETEMFTICLEPCYECCEYISAVVVSPEDGADVEVPRYSGGSWGLTEYHIQHIIGSRIVSYESNGEKLGSRGKVETDAFIIETLGGGSIKIRTLTTAGQNSNIVTLYGVGDEKIDTNGFTIKLVSIEDLGEDILKYNITVTSDNKTGGPGGTAALRHVQFDFGRYCKTEINYGAQVTAESIWCNLQVTTESITLRVDKDGVLLSPILPYSTPWAYNCCSG